MKITNKALSIIGTISLLLPTFFVVSCGNDSGLAEILNGDATKPIETPTKPDITKNENLIDLEKTTSINSLLEGINNYIHVFMNRYAGLITKEGLDKTTKALSQSGLDEILSYLKNITAKNLITIKYKDQSLQLDFSEVQNQVKAILDSNYNTPDLLPKSPDIGFLLKYEENPEMTSLLSDAVGYTEALGYSVFLQLGGTDLPTNHYYGMLNAHHSQIWKLKSWAPFGEWVKDKEYELYIPDDKNKKHYENAAASTAPDKKTPTVVSKIKPGDLFDSKDIKREIFGQPRPIVRDGQLQVSNLELQWVEKIMHYDGNPVNVVSEDDIWAGFQ